MTPSLCARGGIERMERRYTSVLLSGLVFPGAGQLYNNQAVKGIVYILLTLCFIIALVYVSARSFWRALEYSESTGGPVWDGIVQGFGGYKTAIVVLLAILGITWAAGIVDAYLTARKGEIREVRRFIARRR
jgi:hypothetical protein